MSPAALPTRNARWRLIPCHRKTAMYWFAPIVFLKVSTCSKGLRQSFITTCRGIQTAWSREMDVSTDSDKRQKTFWYLHFTPRTTLWMTLYSMYSTRSRKKYARNWVSICQSQTTTLLWWNPSCKRFSMPRFLQELITWSYHCSIATQSGNVSRMKR